LWLELRQQNQGIIVATTTTENELKNALDRAKRAEQRLAQVLTTQQLTAAAANLGFRKAEHAVKLGLDTGRLRFDPETEQVVGVSPMDTPETVLRQVADDMPFLIAPPAAGGKDSGTGSSEATGRSTGKLAPDQVFGPKANGTLANRLAIDNPKEYARLKQVAIDQGIITAIK